jgi:hypothetical protein
VQPGGCTSNKLTAQPVPQGLRLSGIFGVFDIGNLLLFWLDVSGEAIGSVFLHEVTPSELVTFEQTLQPPAGATAVALSVLAAADGTLRPLGKCEFE